MSVLFRNSFLCPAEWRKQDNDSKQQEKYFPKRNWPCLMTFCLVIHSDCRDILSDFFFWIVKPKLKKKNLKTKHSFKKKTLDDNCHRENYHHEEKKGFIRMMKSKQECIAAINLLHNSENTVQGVHDSGSIIWERAKSEKPFSMTDICVQETLWRIINSWLWTNAIWSSTFLYKSLCVSQINVVWEK